MKKEITLCEAIGKPLTDFQLGDFSSQAVFIFGDEFCCVGVDFGYDHGDGEIEEQLLMRDSYFGEKLVEVGILTQKELDASRKAREDEWKLKCQNDELRLYEKLKAKFE